MSKVEIVSRETIKPCSPTPTHLRRLQLSLLEQLLPPVHLPPVILYFPGNKDDGKSFQLKKSLSEILTHFYPLAGRVEETDGLCYLDCNDQGVECIDVRVKGELSEILRQRVVSELNLLVPCAVCCSGTGDVLLAVQLNMFDCGGLAISVCVSHKIADGASLTMLLNAWANATRRGDNGRISREVVPSFVTASVFPPRSTQREAQVQPTLTANLVTRRFVFEAPQIQALQENPGTRADDSPTRVEALSALIWRCAVRAQGEAAMAKISVATHAVNIRGRSLPPLPEYSFGNLWIPAVAAVPAVRVVEGDGDGGRRFLDGQLRDAIRRVNGEFLRQVEERGGVVALFAGSKFQGVALEPLHFSSWCRFPLYESDFGWGRPEWVSIAGYSIKNTVIFLETRSSQGIEVWVTMGQEEMGRFERDQELLAFVSSL